MILRYARNFMDSKKAYFFVIDAFVAILILSVGMYMVLSSHMSFPDRDQTALSSRSLLNFMSNMTIADYNSDYKFDVIMGLSSTNSENFIRRYDNTIAEQIAEFYFREAMDPFPDNINGVPESSRYSEGLARDVVEKTVPSQFEVHILITDYVEGNSETIFRRNDDPTFDEDEAELMVPYKTILMGDFEDQESQRPILWGPYVLEVRVWQ